MRPAIMVKPPKLCGPLLLLSTLIVEASQTASYKYVVKETFIPHKDWVRLHPAPPDFTLPLRINLAQPQFGTLVDHLYAVSDPDNPQYGHHLSKVQVQALTAPSPQGLAAVQDWLISHGFDLKNMEWSPSKDCVKFRTSVQKAEKMFDTTYHSWKNSKTNEHVVRTTAWRLPEHLGMHIDLVHPTNKFPSIIPQVAKYRILDEEPVEQSAASSFASPSSQRVDPSCNDTITPTCLLQIYNATHYKVQVTNKDNQIAVTSYAGQFPNIDDLQQFYAAMRPDAINSSFDLISINGEKNTQASSEAGVEANLDTQYAFALTFPIRATVYTTAGRAPFVPDQANPDAMNEPFLEWLDFMLERDHIPHTISTSYGDDEQTVPFSYARKVCDKLAMLGTRGVTLTFSSGDGGVGPSVSNAVCQTNDGRNETEFIPTFPATCPYVTTVGGTEKFPEVAVSSFGSGGGFSKYFSRPSYQDAVIKPFLKALGNTNQGLFNAHGRGYPDVSAQGDNYLIFVRGKKRLVGGTSASSPTFAAMVALLNDARIAEGMPPLGFLNLLLYSKAFHAFNDITIGNNPGCGTDGFSCRDGWDPVTGFGTPNFGLLKELVMKVGTSKHKHKN